MVLRRLAILVALAGCATQTATAVGAITNGSADSGDPAVIGLVDDLGEVGCTATVIEAHTAITAAHCVAGRVPLALRAVFGSDVATGTLIDVSGAQVDPGFDPGTLANDLAVVTLRDESPAVAVAIAPADTTVGTIADSVGFGTTSSTATDGGTKRAGTVTISDVQPSELTAMPSPGQPCHGDSGGPLLIGGAIVAVASRGDTGCSDHAIYERIDVAQQVFVAPYLAATAPGTAGSGAACLYDEQCPSGYACSGELVCVVQTEDGCGGCTTGGGAPAGLVIVVLGFARGRRRLTNLLHVD
jgi:secreted trypsin-like serine protease